MKILFMHPNMPGQYKHLARIMAQDPDNEVVFLTKPKKGNIPNVKKVEYKVTRDVSPESHRYLIPVERGVLASQEVWRVCKKMKDNGFIPDVICGHLGWGDGFFLKDIFPDSPVLAFMEFFYDGQGSDSEFLNNSSMSADSKARVRTKNLIHLMNLTYADWGICPTHFQLQRHPEIFHSKISVLHDGVDTNAVTPVPDKILTLPNGVKLTANDEVITYISRNFEPYRGFPQFMRSAEIILKNRPNAHIIMVGQDGVSYGAGREDGKTWREAMMEEVSIPQDRFHFLGYLPHDQMVKVLQISQAHIYLTVPFVLSWSMMEAMSAGCLVIGSDTPPVREAIKDGYNGLLVDFFSHEALAARIDEVFQHPDRMKDLRIAARKTILDRYSLDKVLPMHLDLIHDVAKGSTPPKTASKIDKFDQETQIISPAILRKLTTEIGG